MAYSEDLAGRVRDVLAARGPFAEKRMFGGLAWMLQGNMACALASDGRLMVRLGPEDAERAIAEAEAEPMEMSGRRMRGFVLVDAATVIEDGQLARWVDAGADFALSLPPK